MTQKIYQVDAFAEAVFSGNPAAVCPLETWPGDDLLQKIAAENNLAETAFYVKDGDRYQLRWFTPTVEVDLCGHATLAAAFVLFHHEGHKGESIHFHSPRSGSLRVTKNGEWLCLNFPADTIIPVELSEEINACFDIRPRQAFKGRSDYLLVFDNEGQIKTIVPALEKIGKLNCRGVIITAPGDTADFVSRFFAPQSGIPEDPVTGSAHTTLTPYWAAQLNKTELNAIQLSERKGHLQCGYLNDRITLSGKGKLYLIGEIYLK